MAEAGESHLIRPIFFYNAVVPEGEVIRLHLFEERFCFMMERIIHTHRQFVFLPNFSDYIPHRWDIGVVTEIFNFQRIPNGRWNIEARALFPVMVRFHWMEPDSHGLHYCYGERIPRPLPTDPAPTLSLARRLFSARNGLYRVAAPHTHFMPVYANPGPQPLLLPMIGEVRHASTVRVIEERGQWMRHDGGVGSGEQPTSSTEGWSLAQEPFHRLVPETTLARELIGRHGGGIAHVLNRSPIKTIVVSGTKEQIAGICKELEDSHPGANTMVEKELLPKAESVVALSSVLDTVKSLVSQCHFLGAHGQVEATLCAVLDDFLRDMPLATARGMNAAPFTIVQARPVEDCNDVAFSGHGDVVPLGEYLEAQYGSRPDACSWIVLCRNSESHIIENPRSLTVRKDHAQGVLYKVSTRLNWCRARLVFIGNRERGCGLSVLPVELAALIASYLHTDMETV